MDSTKEASPQGTPKPRAFSVEDVLSVSLASLILLLAVFGILHPGLLRF